MPDYVPNTVVKVLRNVPLDSTYTDTRWFDSESEQVAFFTGKAKYTFTDMTYQRVNNSVAQPRGPLTCRVPRIADDLYDCNYIMFQNTNYGSKWFYAFIRQVNYISPSNTEIVYEIDYLQSFMFEFQIKPCFVEREHASAREDNPFTNLVPEPVEIPIWCEDIANHERVDTTSLGISTSPKIVVTAVPSSVTESIFLGFDGAVYSGVYSGAVYKVYDVKEYGEVTSLLKKLAAVDGQNAVVSVYMTPCEPKKGWGTEDITVQTKINLKDESFNTVKGAYKIRNKKLLNGQFTYIKASSDTGEEISWLPELFGTDTLTAICRVGYLPTFSMFFAPQYMGYRSAGTGANEYGLSFEQGVNCVWNSYGFLGDFIKNAAKVAVAVGAAYATGGSSVAASAGGSAGTGLSTSVRGATIDEMIPSAQPSKPDIGGELSSVLDMFTSKGTTVKGSTAGDAMAFAMGLHGFELRRMCPDYYTLQRLDTFFDMFGYAVNTVKQPNLNTRASWNYVKLKNPCIFGSVPVQGMDAIKAAFARGIRLWHIDAVGDYSAQNPAK
nr:MAG TPA: Major tail protein [Caudoviricetes sp.]